ncbi:autotransporter outer membrane beta-barrel domain-containing protein, partial [Variovorax sp. WS11]|uniref:autotransporter-associated beta strand repeat-containing protein n=1 Tax=Variovorax sp. WS11 TaxID=1105204 RepID=UPI000D2E085C
MLNGGTVVNDVNSTIRSQDLPSSIRAGSVYIDGGDATLVNKGALVGRVVFDPDRTGFVNTATLFTGSSLQGNLDMGANTASSLVLDGSGQQLLSNAVTDGIQFAGKLVGQGGGTWIIDGDLAPASTTIAADSTLQLGNGGTFGSIAGPIDTNGTLAINRSNALTLGDTISGAGGLSQTGTGTTVLTADNSYLGGTRLNAGVLSVSSNANLGDAAGGLAFGGGTLQTTADITMNRATTLDSQGGTIDTLVSTTLTHQGVVGGAGALTKTGTGTLTLAGENTYSGGTDLKEGRVAVRNNRALGTGELAMHEGTMLRFAADGLTLDNAIAFTDAVDPIVDTGPFTATLTGAITGPGDLSKIGSGTLILSGANTYTGATAVTEGTLRAGVSNTFSAASAHSVASGATLDLAGLSQSVAGLTNSGTVSLIGSTPGTTLTVTGPYVGNNGLLRLGTFLGDSASESDRLVLSGPSATASGNTTVQVVNLGGLGALTSGNGIELVSALNGATTTAQSTKDAFALQGGHVDAGAYEYRLQAGDAAGTGENWYLRSTSTIMPPAPPAPPAPPVPPA